MSHPCRRRRSRPGGCTNPLRSACRPASRSTAGGVASYLTPKDAGALTLPALSRQVPVAAPDAVSGPEYVALVHDAIPSRVAAGERDRDRMRVPAVVIGRTVGRRAGDRRRGGVDVELQRPQLNAVVGALETCRCSCEGDHGVRARSRAGRRDLHLNRRDVPAVVTLGTADDRRADGRLRARHDDECESDHDRRREPHRRTLAVRVSIVPVPAAAAAASSAAAARTSTESSRGSDGSAPRPG